MAPDRGSSSASPEHAPLMHPDSSPSPPPAPRRRRGPPANLADTPNFTLRGVLVGLAIGVVICFSNMYFGLQTGWVSSMAMPSALIGFAWFKAVARYIELPFSPAENVLVQSVAGSVGVMPLGCGFVGVIPALEYLLKPTEGGPLHLGLGRLVVWAVGICFFGVVFAVPLRREVIIREKLKFPSGTATALMIGVLHRDPDAVRQEDVDENRASKAEEEEREGLIEADATEPEENHAEGQIEVGPQPHDGSGLTSDGKSDWKAKIRLLIISFIISAVYTLLSYFIPQLRHVPFLGLNLANNWLWTLNPSPAYVGQGIIMGPSTTTHMLIGAILGWGILSPLAKSKGWAPGPVSDWTTGSKGWIVWISLAIMLADSLVSLGWLILRPVIYYTRTFGPDVLSTLHEHSWKDIMTFQFTKSPRYTPLRNDSAHSSSYADGGSNKTPLAADSSNEDEDDAPPSHLIGTRTTVIGLILSLGLSVGAVHATFPSLIPFYLTLLAMVLALLLSIMGVRALGETDLNPVSGISKLTQLIFAFTTPTSSASSPHNPSALARGAGNNNAVIINLVAGALSESGALQAGDLLQDLKTGHLLYASPKAQFYGQLIGSAVGAVVSALVYRLYTHVYDIPGGMFQVPTAYVWVFTARLVLGEGLPMMVGRWAAGAGLLWAVFTGLRVWGRERRRVGGAGRAWVEHAVPGGIAVAVGMYNVPSFTLARATGGFINLYWRRWRGKPDAPIVVLASGLILGEGVFSIVNLGLASLGVPHL